MKQLIPRSLGFSQGYFSVLSFVCAGLFCTTSYASPKATEVKVTPTAPVSLKVKISEGDVQTPNGKPIHVVATELQFDGPAVEIFRARDAAGGIPVAPGNYDPKFEKMASWPGAIRLTPIKDKTGTHILGNFFRTFRDETLTVKSEAGFKPYVRDVDYVYMPEWGLIVNKDDRMSGKIMASAEGALQRLDLVQVGPDGKPTVKKGQSSWLCPALPEADSGCVALAGIYIAPWRAARNPFYDNKDAAALEKASEYAITQHEICVIKHDSSPVAPIDPGNITKVLKKLKAGESVKIAFLGDSITLGAEANKWWQPEPYTAKDMTYRGRVIYELRRRYPEAKIEPIEAHRGGVPISYGTKQMEETVAPQKPDLVIVAFGANDVNSEIGAEPTTSMADFGAALAGIADKAKAYGGEALFVTPFPIHPWLKNGAAQRLPGHIAELKKVAKDHGATVADVYAEFSRLVDRGIPPWSQNHNWTNHPSDFGHRIYADTVLRCFGLETQKTPAASTPKLLAQTAPPMGDWDLTQQPFPDLQAILDRPAPNLPVYGVYCWPDEYVRRHDFIRKVGWTTLRLGGKADDDAIRLTAQDNMEVMYSLGGSIQPGESDDAFVAHYVETVEKALVRYGPGGSFFKENPEVPNHPLLHIEIGNEPNFHYLDGKMSFKDSADRTATLAHRAEVYGKMVVAANKMIKSRWPAVKVVAFAAGGAANADGQFIRDTLAKNAEVAQSYDILSTHPYISAPPEANAIASWGRYSIAGAYQGIRKTMEEFGNKDKPVWYTELNWEILSKEGGRYPENDQNNLGTHRIPSEFQAANVVRGYALALRLGVPRLTYMSLVDTDHCNSGFLNLDGSWRPSAHAIATMIRVMPRPKLTGAIEDGKGNTYVYRLNPDYKTKGHEVIMAWCAQGPRTIEIPWDAESVEVTDMLGKSEVLKATNGKVPLEIGPFPVYLSLPPITKEREQAEKMWKSWLATPITFYGKVVDEKNNPVPAADVSLSFADHAFEGDTKRDEKTDSNGLFHVSGHGLGVVVMVSKKGYYHLDQSDGNFGYAKVVGQTNPHPDPNNPAIFVLRKWGKIESLVVKGIGGSLAKNGIPMEINLLTGEKVSAGQGHIRIECWTSDQRVRLHSNEHFDWRCRISVSGGGLVERTGEFDFKAPADGYQESAEINMTKSLGHQWQSSIAKDYFLKLASGTYARIHFMMNAGGEQPFSLTSYLNPQSGSLNLECDPAQ